MPQLLFLLVILGLTACGTNPPAAPDAKTVRIIRDNYGVPHVYADTRFGVFYGYGYAVAQDRLFQMEMARRSTQGTVAEVLGPEFVEFDVNTRLGFSPASIVDQLTALPKADRDIFQGYVAGFNARLREVRADPDHLMPKQFEEFGFSPRPWTAYDLAMVFVGTMANRYGDFNTELENAMMLLELVKMHGQEDGKKIFNHLNPRITEGAPTSISKVDWANGAASPLETASVFSPMDVPETPIISGFSNCWVLGPKKSQGANAILVNGPQFGWFSPSYVYSVGLHGADFDLVGNTPFAYPVLLFGHNDTIAWGSTWGAGDIVDLYEVKLDSNNPEQYLYEGKYRAFESREEVIRVRGADAVRVTARRSVHGAIIQYDPERGVAYAKQRAWDGREIQSLLAWLHSTRTKNYEDWVDHAEQAALNINWYYADRSGNIGYAFVGHYPERHPQHDNRLPVSGDGRFDWQGRQSFAHNPKAKNPVSGFIANWNNKPAPGVLNPDEFWYSWSSADRVDFLHDAIEAQATFTPDQAWDLIRTSSYADVIAPYFLDWIEQAAINSGDGRLTAASDLLKRWNLLSQDSNGDGFFDEPQTTLFRAFVARLQETVLADDLGSIYPMFASVGYPTVDTPTAAGTNIQTGTKTLVEALKGNLEYDFLNGETRDAVIASVLQETIVSLNNRYGADPGSWRLKVPTRPYSTRNFLGVPQTSKAYAFEGPIEQNRGTENNMVVLRSDNIVAYEVTPPGQSGFVAPNGDRSEHFDDQLEMYNSFNRKRIWFYPEDLEPHMSSETVLRY